MAKLTMRMVRASLAAVGVTIKHDREWSEYVVRIKGSPAGHGYHTSDLADAYQTGHAMALEDENTRDAAIAFADGHRLRPGLAPGSAAAQRNAMERAKREDEQMLGLPAGSIKA